MLAWRRCVSALEHRMHRNAHRRCVALLSFSMHVNRDNAFEYSTSMVGLRVFGVNNKAAKDNELARIVAQ